MAEIERAVERALGEITGRPVEVSVAEERLYPDPDGGGFTSLAAGLIGMVVVVVGMAFVPHLFAEEKETQTLQVLPPAPARWYPARRWPARRTAWPAEARPWP